MKVTFVIPNHNLSGGNRVIAIHADWLARHGHDVTVVAGRYPQPSLSQKLRSVIRGRGWPVTPRREDAHFKGTSARLTELEVHRPVTDADIPDGDIVIATYWTTAEAVARLSPAKGKKVYFLQHYEIHDGLPKDRVKATWRLPFRKIVVSEWLRRVAETEFSDREATLVPNGVDLDLFFAPERGRQSRPTVGMLYSGTPYKGCDTILEAVDIASRRVPNLKLVAFGSQQPEKRLPLPASAEFHFRPAQDRIRDIYAKCDAWLFGSRTEGYGLPILEAMACRTPVIGTPAGAAPELLADGRGILVPPEDSGKMAQAIVDLFALPEEEWGRMSRAAFDEASRHGWGAACERFEEALRDALEGA